MIPSFYCETTVRSTHAALRILTLTYCLLVDLMKLYHAVGGLYMYDFGRLFAENGLTLIPLAGRLFFQLASS